MHDSRREMDRRSALRRLAGGSSAVAVLPALSQTARARSSDEELNPTPEPVELGSAMPPDPALASKHWKPLFFDSHQNETVIALSDLIIPETDTPGAKAAQVNRFIDLLLAAEAAGRQKEYIEALSWLDGYCLSHHSRPFAMLGQDEQSEVLRALTYPNDIPGLKRGFELFQTVKGSIVQAYYTSKIGMLDELQYQTDPFQPTFPGCKDQPEYPKA